MFLKRMSEVGLVIALTVSMGIAARAQQTPVREGLIQRMNPFRADGPEQPVSVIDISNRLDHLSESLRDDGLVVVKRPDVFSQARMTHFRTDFENQLVTDLKMFHLVLAARINRLDSATTTQTTNLSGALAAPGTTNLHSVGGSTSSAGLPSPPSAASIPGTSSTLDPTKNSFSSLGLDTNIPNAQAVLGLGVDPTVYLDEKRRFLEHLNQLRRINHGPDQNDSSGYGLYLIRLPVSITPGERTYQGFGAELAVTAEHEFPPDFLQSSFRNLVINDLVDQLSPPIYEVIRSGTLKILKAHHDAQSHLNQLKAEFPVKFAKLRKYYFEPTDESVLGLPPIQNAIEPIARFIARDPADYPHIVDPRFSAPSEVLERRFSILKEAFKANVQVEESYGQPDIDAQLAQFDEIENKLLQGKQIKPGKSGDIPNLVSAIKRLLTQSLFPTGNAQADAITASRFNDFFFDLYSTSLDDDRKLLDMAQILDSEYCDEIGRSSKEIAEVAKQEALLHRLKLSLPSTRNTKQRYPIAPLEMMDFFLEDNIYVLANTINDSLLTPNPRLTDIRSHLRQSLYVAYDVMSQPLPDAGTYVPLDNIDLINDIYKAVKAREFTAPGPGQKSVLKKKFDELVKLLESGNRRNIYDKNAKSYRPIAPLAWAIAIDAGLLDAEFRDYIPRVFAANDFVSPIPENARFYCQHESLIAPAVPIFQQFVKLRWPVITFAIDPVAEQQNVADSFSLQRDLQLALSFAFATGQIGFGQLNTFRRQIQQSSDTIALNRTVTGFIQDNDTFGFRFTPRFQNPPMQRTNFGVIASQLISGGPGPDYQTKKSKLEPGMRELTAILLLPTFLPTLRMEVSSNWFKLNDPEHLVFHTRRMMERGREVQELRRTVVDACSELQYRRADLNVLKAKLAQLEQILPAQSKVVQLPFENTASGFDLFADGATALVPELSGYDAVDYVRAPGTTGGGNPTDIFIYGKYFDLLDTYAIAGGITIPRIGSTQNQSSASTVATATPAQAYLEIISREVAHLNIPSTAQPTTTIDGKTYLEVYLATPSGISNRVLVPYMAATPAPLVAFDLSTDTQELDVFYQWSTGADARLFATDDPGTVDKKPLKISWDAATGMAPKTLLATFSGNLGGQTLSFSLPANSGNKDEYGVDRQLMTVMLLKRLQGMYPALTPLPASFTLKVSVQPYLPVDGMGYRVLSKAKDLKTQLTIKTVYYATGKDALQNVTEPPPPPKPAASTAPSGNRGNSDSAPLDTPVRAVSLFQSVPSFTPTPKLSVSPVAVLDGTIPKFVPNVAENLGEIPALLASPSAAAQAVAKNLVPGAVGMIPSSIPAIPAPPTIVVNPAPVTVIAPHAPPPTKSHSLLHRMFDKGRKATGAAAR